MVCEEWYHSPYTKWGKWALPEGHFLSVSLDETNWIRSIFHFPKRIKTLWIVFYDRDGRHRARIVWPPKGVNTNHIEVDGQVKSILHQNFDSMQCLGLLQPHKSVWMRVFYE